MDQNSHFHMQSDVTRHSYSPSRTAAAFKLDEGFSEDIRSQDEGGQVGLSASAAGFEEWVMAQSEEARAGKPIDVRNQLPNMQLFLEKMAAYV